MWVACMAQDFLHKFLYPTVHAQHECNSPPQLPEEITVTRMLAQTNLESQSGAANDGGYKGLKLPCFSFKMQIIVAGSILAHVIYL
jgi:hypothetical protein